MIGSPQKMPRPNGNSIRPVVLGVASRIFRNHSGSNNWYPKLMAFDRNCVAAAARKTRARNNRRSISAVTGCLDACQIKPASSRTLGDETQQRGGLGMRQRDHPSQQQREAGRYHREAEQIEPPRIGDLVAGQREPCETDRQQADRDIDEKDPAPAEKAEDHAPQTGPNIWPTMTGMAATPMTRAI